MFWKKKNDNEVIIELDTDERRQGVRIQPLDDIVVHHNTHQFKLIDISFMGLAFAPISNELASSGDYKSANQITISFSLPSFKTLAAIELHCQVQVIQIRDTTCCSQFVALTAKTQLHIDQFILAEQKRQIHLLQDIETHTPAD